MPRFEPNQVSGQFSIRVTASYRGLSASASIAQSNVAGAGAGSAAGHAGISGKTIGILVGIAAAGAVGAAVGLSGGKGSTSQPTSNPVPTTPSGTISLGSGTVTFGPPR
jgi:hypothetical protein